MKNDRTIFDLSINEKNKFIKHYIGIDMGKAGGDKSINIKVDMRGINPKIIMMKEIKTESLIKISDNEWEREFASYWRI